MRILFCTYSTASDLFATIPFAWALRAAGHEILYAGGGEGMREVAKAGLPYVDIATPGVDLAAPFARRAAQSREKGQLVWYRGGDLQEDEVRATSALFAELSELVVPGAVRLARQWRPDLVVSPDHQGSGAVVAGLLSVPLIAMSNLFALVPDMVDRIRGEMAGTYDRYGIDPGSSRTRLLRTTPPSLFRASGNHLAMRPVPYNGSYLELGTIPDWLLRSPDRPRVCVTLGTFIPQYIGLSLIRDFVAELDTVDADFVFVLGDADRTELGTLPDNVRSHGWIPLNTLLDSCDAIIHHGGTSTSLAAMSAGIRQIVLPHGSDQPSNARLVAERGLGVTCAAAELTAKTITTVLEAPEIGTAAAQVREEIARLPSPSGVASALPDLVG